MRTRVRASSPNIFVDAGYEYGLFVGSYRGVKSVWHDGQKPGLSAFVRMIPERDLGVVVLLNRRGIRSDRIVDAALDALGVPTAPQPRLAPRPAFPMSAAEMERYAGRYTNRFPVEVFVRDGARSSSVPQSDCVPLRHIQRQQCHAVSRS